MSSVGFAVIGAGQWGEQHADVFASTQGARFVGVSDSDIDRAKWLAYKYGATFYPDYHSLLEDDSIRGVSIATPDFAHGEVALSAVKAGKHVLCEKPLAMTVEECMAVIEAADSANVKLMVDFHSRWNPPVYEAWEAIRDGQVGTPLHAYYRLNNKIWVPKNMLSWADRTTVEWFLGSHAIDTLRWLMGDEVQRVYAVSRSQILKPSGVDTPDFYQCILEFRSGAVATLENSWVLPNTTPTMIDLKCAIIGSQGALYIDGSHHRAVEQYTLDEVDFPDVFVMPSVQGKRTGFATESIRHFVDCVLHDKIPLVTGRDGLEATKVILAIQESADTGQPVDVI